MKQPLPQNSFENMRATEASMGTREVIMQRISKRAQEDRKPCHSRTTGGVALTMHPGSWWPAAPAQAVANGGRHYGRSSQTRNSKMEILSFQDSSDHLDFTGMG